MKKNYGFNRIDIVFFGTLIIAILYITISEVISISLVPGWVKLPFNQWIITVWWIPALIVILPIALFPKSKWSNWWRK